MKTLWLGSYWLFKRSRSLQISKQFIRIISRNSSWICSTIKSFLIRKIVRQRIWKLKYINYSIYRRMKLHHSILSSISIKNHIRMSHMKVFTLSSKNSTRLSKNNLSHDQISCRYYLKQQHTYKPIISSSTFYFVFLISIVKKNTKNTLIN